MKKLMLASFGLALSFASFANTTTTFFYDGSTSAFSDVLLGAESHTEYRTESYPSTCFRNEISGYTSMCVGGGYYRNGGYYGGPRGPRYNGGYYGGYNGGYYGPSYGTNCYREPIYRTVSYACTETKQIPYSVKDFDVTANVNINVLNSSNKKAAESIIATINSNGTIKLTAYGTKNFLIVVKKKNIDVQTNGSEKLIDASYDVELVDASVLKALEVKNLNASFTGVTFDYSAVDKNNLVATSLKIEKKRFLAKKKNMFDAELNKTQINAAGTKADVKFANIGLDLKKGRYVFTVTTEIKTDGNLLNAAQFGGQLVKSVELKKKIK